MDYNIIAFDAQYILSKQFSALKKRASMDSLKFINDDSTSIGYVITEYQFTVHDLVEKFFWSIVKFIRDDYNCNKVILLWDKAPYLRSKILSDYKAGREYHSQDTVDEWDLENDPQGYLQEAENYRAELIKQEAKYWIINNLHDFGFPSIIYDGYEADDLAEIFSNSEAIEVNDGLKSAICSVDSDWMCWTSKKVDWINHNDKEAWTYDDAILEYGMDLDTDLSLFEIKMYYDSFFGSHNALVKTCSVTRRKFKQLIDEVRHEDYSHITDIDQMKRNLKSFDIKSFKNYNEVNNLIYNTIKCKSGYWTEKKYLKLVAKGFKITKSYFDKNITYLNPIYYESADIS